MKYIAIIDADERPVSCEFIGCNGNVTPYLIGATTDIKALEQEPCTDAVSREEAVKVLRADPSFICTGDKTQAITDILSLPTVTPEIPKMDKADKYKKVAMDLLTEYMESEQAVIGEFSGDFKKSALIFKKKVMRYLKRLDEGEDTFNKLVKNMWIADYYKAESEG